MKTATTTNTITEGRFGYHPCDYETYLKLKKAHKLLLRAYVECKAYLRWVRKQPQNRSGNEPKAPKNFIESGMHKLDKKEFYGLGFRRINCKESRYKNLYLHVLKQYQICRRPADCIQNVQEVDIPDNLNAIILELEEFYSN